MLNAKDTLKKIAEALNIATETPADEAVAPTPEAAAEPVAPTPDPVVAEVVAPAAEPVAEPVAETPAAEVVSEEPVEDLRVKALEQQLADLKGILADAMKVEDPIPEIPQAAPQGLTHSPEAVVRSESASGIGKKGASIQERVFKYINNN